MFSLLTNHPFEIFDLTGSDMIIVILMIIVFILALVVPHPDSRPSKRGQP